MQTIPYIVNDIGVISVMIDNKIKSISPLHENYDTIKDAINLAVNSDEFEIQINPDDLSVVEKFKQEIIDSISGLNNIVLRPDPTLERGGCKLESSCCTVDASMISQIKVIHDSIMAAENLSELTKNTEPEDTLIEE